MEEAVGGESVSEETTPGRQRRLVRSIERLPTVGGMPSGASDEPVTAARVRPGAGLDERAVAWARRGLVLLAYCVATVIMTWPWVPQLATGIPPGGDPLLQVWISRWVQHALVTDPLHLYDANAFYPLRYTLAYSDSNIPAGLLAAPLYLLTGNAILANNLLALGTFVLAACGLYALVGLLTGNRAVAFLTGLAYAFLPYRFAHLWHLNQLGHAWTPWVLFALVLLIRHGRWRHAVAFGLLLAVQILTSFYLAFQIAFAIAIVLLVALVAAPHLRSVRFLRQIAVAGLLALMVVVPLALPYTQVREQQGLERTVGESEEYSATPSSYLRVQRRNKAWSWLTDHQGGEDTLFPGGLVLVGAVVGLVGWRRRPAATVALLLVTTLGVILSLGPTWRPGSGTGPPLPYRLLFDYFPFFKAMRVPARFGALALLGLILLAGLGASWAWERLAPRVAARSRLRLAIGATAALAILLLAELYTAPMPIVPVDRSEYIAAPYRWLAEQPGREPVMEFPAAKEGDTVAAEMYWSTLHWRPIVGGYSGFAPRAHADLITTFSADLTRPDGAVVANVSYVTPDNIGVIQTLGVRYLVIHRYGYKREDWPTVIARLEATGGAVEKVGDFGEAVIYRVRPAAEAPSPIQVELYAPSLAITSAFWEPALVVRNTSAHKELFFINRPLTLTTTWRDAAGKVARRDTLPLSLPAVLPAGDLFCAVRACPITIGAPLPPTDASSTRLYPEQPGQYTVELAITGGFEQHRTFPVEVTPAALAAQPDGPPLALVDVALDSGEATPGTTLGMTLTWEARQASAEDYTLFAQVIGPDGKVWGQYDAPAGWTGHYTSAWLPGERLTLPWSVPLQADAPPGQYRLLVGMYRRLATGVERLPLGYPGGTATEAWVAEVAVP